MLTIAETRIFSRPVSDYWSEDERGEFAVWIAEHFDAGDVVRGSGGCRKVRWSRKGTGKSGGVRIIYYNMLEDGTIWLLLIYAKNEHKYTRPYIEGCEGGINMPMTENELQKRDAARDLGAELLESVREMKAGHATKIHNVTIAPVVSARMKSGLSQSAFAKLLGVSIRTLQDWEQGRRTPSGAAKTLIAIAERRPEVLR